jgi:uncharacterized protein YcfJ
MNRQLSIYPLQFTAVLPLKKRANIKNQLMGFGLTLLVAATASAEQFDNRSANWVDKARVLSAVPVYSTIKEVTPRQECWVDTIAQEHYVPARRYSNNTPLVVGGVVGGVLGHAVGHGHSNKKLGAVVGSVLGAAVGQSVAAQQHQQRGDHGYTRVEYTDVERCKTIEETTTRQVFDGYDVTYEYLGNIYTARLPRSPGNELQVAVQITPLSP